MHDHLGHELKVGDRVLIPCVVKELYPAEEYCNVSLESCYGRRPDDQKETVSAINTGVLVRWNEGDILPGDL